MDKVEGHLEVGTNGKGEVVINHPRLVTDENGVGHIVFSPRQADELATLLWTNAMEARAEQFRLAEQLRLAEKGGQ